MTRAEQIQAKQADAIFAAERMLHRLQKEENNMSVAKFVTPSEVLRVHLSQYEPEVKKVVTLINERLLALSPGEEAHVKASQMGGCERVRSIVLKMLSDAGWTAGFEDNSYESFYIIRSRTPMSLID